MDQRAEQSIMVMLNGFPQTSQDYQTYLRTLRKLCEGMASEAIAEAAKRFAAGEVKDQSLKFAPATAEFVQEAKRIDGLIPYRNRPALPSPSYQRGKLAPFEVAIAKAESDMAAQGRALLDDNATLDEFKAKARSGQIPFGSTWRLGKIYGPATIETRQGSLDMPAIGQEGGLGEL